MAAHHDCGARAPGLAAPELAAGPAAGLASLGAPGAAASGLTAGHLDGARELVGGAGFRGQGKPNEIDCPGAAQAAQAISSHNRAAAFCAQDDHKRFATLRARLALRGWALTGTSAADGPVVFVAMRWNMQRELASMDAVADFADRVGAPQ